MLSYLNVRANIGLFLFNLKPCFLASPSPLIPIYHQPSRVENVIITCFLNFSGGFGIVFSS